MSATVKSIVAAISNGSLPNALTPSATNTHLGWPDMTKMGEPKPTLRNAKLAVQRLNIQCKFDNFRQRKLVHGHPLREFSGDLTDDCCNFIRNMILEKFDFDPKPEHVRDAISMLCLENPFHPILDYIDAQKWDGVPRLHILISHYFGGVDTPLNRVIGRKLMIAAVRRVREPGCKFDPITVLEGGQGSGKSSAVKILAGQDNFSDNEILTLSTKEQIEMMEGVWLYELGELEGLSRADTTKVKAFASRSEDSARMSYERLSGKRKRQCIFIGTTNDNKYLRDRTGNRRFWPVQTGIIDLAALRRDRDQLWAEAAHWELLGGELTLPRGLWAVATVEQEARLEDDPWSDALADIPDHNIHTINGLERVKSSTLLTSVLNIPIERQQSYHQTRVGKLMRELGWEGPKALRFKGCKPDKGYQRPTTSSVAQKGIKNKKT